MPLKSNVKRLALSRHENESVVIRMGSVDVRVGVFEARAGKAKLFFEAPETVKILRSEIVGSRTTPVHVSPQAGDQSRG